MERRPEDRGGETGPTGPCFVFGARGYLEFDEHFSSMQEARRSWAIGPRPGIMSVYDSTGLKWELSHVDSAYRRSRWLLLTSVVFDPMVPITLHWHEPTEYPLEHLRDAYSKAVDEDDDILTQFVEAWELKRRISAAQSFKELVGVFRWMEADHSSGEHGVA